MKKKLITITLFFSILLSGCGTSESHPAEDTDTWEDDTEYEEADTDYEEDFYEEPEEEVLETYPFTELRPFSEERAWVNFRKDNGVYTGIIDTDGKLLYQAKGEFFYMSQFEDGTAFYRETSDETSPCGIIDLEGNVLFESEITSDGGYLILAYGNKHFLAVQHIQNFDENEWKYGTLDQNGKVLNEFKVDDGSLDVKGWQYEDNFQYIGENFIEFKDKLYNVMTSSVSPVWGGHILGDFFDGYTMIGNSRYAYLIDTNYPNGYKEGTVMTLEGAISEISGSFGSYDEGLLRGEGISESKEYLDRGYYDKNGNLVISLDEKFEHNFKNGGFHGGYAVIIARGADGADYVCAIDKSGNLGYQPVKIDGNKYDPDNSSNGYFQITIDDVEKVIDPSGKLYILGSDDLSVCEGLTFGDISDGFIMMDSNSNLHYVSLDCNTIIDSAKITSESGYVDDSSYSDDFSEDDSLEGESEVSYIVPDSYDITGKWKSVGSSGFGQAQPGAIIVFDGNNCNFYSPNDTYAFYLDGNRYVLDITSLLGESLSFTVNIVDDNNIDISRASLRRIN